MLVSVDDYYLHVEAVFEITQVMFIAAFDISDGAAKRPSCPRERIVLWPSIVVIATANAELVSLGSKQFTNFKFLKYTL